MKRILASAAVVIAAGAFLVITLGSSGGSSNPTYKIELDNAFGLVKGGDFKVAGVIAGSIKSLDLCQYDKQAHCRNPLHAVITVDVSEKGFGSFHSDTFCQSRPQSLIGEYFLDCDPGRSGSVLPPGSTIPFTQTQSTIPADLVQNIMRLPYRQRFTLLINELGAAVASRSEDLQDALRRADPALAETDNLLALLANDAHTIQRLNVNADSVITALAQNKTSVQRFIEEANRAAGESASSPANSSCGGSSTSATCIQATWQKLPGFLEQLKPALLKLGQAADAQDPVLINLNQSASNLQRFFQDLVPFSNESVPSLQSLGKASVTGKSAVQVAAAPVRHLNEFATHTPELAQNLAIVLHDLDDRNRAVEPDLRSPVGKGYTGLEGLLQYVFNITNAVSYYSQWGHLLGVDAYADQACAPFATPQSIANNLAQYKSGQLKENPRSCYAWLGPNQPGVNEPDPSFNKTLANTTTPATPPAPPGTSSPGMANGTNGCVPDPGGYPVQGYGTKYYGPSTSACKLQPTSSGPAADRSNAVSATGSPSAAVPATVAAAVTHRATSGPPTRTSASDLGGTVGQLLSKITVAGGAGISVNTGGGNAGGGPPANQAQQLLNYLLAP